jgi:hypothetical protein
MLPEQIFLLACDLDRHRVPRREIAVVVRGALLAELSLRGCLVTSDEDGTVRASGTRRTGNAVLDDALCQMGEQRPRGWHGWIRRDAWQTTCAVQRRLASLGLISVEPSRILGIFPSTRITVHDPAQVTALRDRVRRIVHGDDRVSDHQAALVALVAVGEVRGVLSRQDRKKCGGRIKELTDQGGAAVPALARVVRQIKVQRSAAAGGG